MIVLGWADWVPAMKQHTSPRVTLQNIKDFGATAVTYVAYHSERKVWTAYVMSGDPDDGIPTVSAIERRVIQNCRLNDLECVVRVKLHNDLLWLMLIEKKVVRSRGIILQKPVYCAHYLGERCLFFTGLNRTSRITNVVANALGYDATRGCSLKGHHIKSLFQLLKNKDAHTCTQATLKEVVYQPERARRTRHGTDFSHSQDRQKYAEDCFGAEPPTLSELTLKVTDTLWQGVTAVPQMEGEMFDCSVTFRSKNVLQMLKEMTELGVIMPPLPTFLKDMPIKATNTININQDRD